MLLHQAALCRRGPLCVCTTLRRTFRPSARPGHQLASPLRLSRHHSAVEPIAPFFTRVAARPATQIVAAQMAKTLETLQPLHATKNGICTDDGSHILSGCFHSAFTTREEIDGITLGLKAPFGPTAVHDFDLGKVSSCTFHSALSDTFVLHYTAASMHAALH